MTWNHRIMVRDGQYAVYDVYYGDDGKIMAFSEDPIPLTEESLEELAETFLRYQRALNEPVLDYREWESELARGIASDPGSRDLP